MNKRLLFLFLLLAVANVDYGQRDWTVVREKIRSEFKKQPGVYALAFCDLQTGQKLLVNEKVVFHAASTMKTPVMIEVFAQVAEGKLSLTDSIVLKNEFRSIVDGSLYSQDSLNDSERSLYRNIGKKKSIADLVYDMIIVSSNFATNLIIDRVGANHVTERMRGLGARDIQVLRGVEDSKAFEKGLNNTTTAYDLTLIFERMGMGTLVSKEASTAMIRILSDQKFNTVIPAKLPPEVKVAHKTGSITGVQHDSGIVFLPDGRKYVLVILSKDWQDEQHNFQVLSSVSRIIYDAFVQ
jgi:beta-lactamase class A